MIKEDTSKLSVLRLPTWKFPHGRNSKTSPRKKNLILSPLLLCDSFQRSCEAGTDIEERHRAPGTGLKSVVEGEREGKHGTRPRLVTSFPNNVPPGSAHTDRTNEKEKTPQVRFRFAQLVDRSTAECCGTTLCCDILPPILPQNADYAADVKVKYRASSFVVITWWYAIMHW